MEWILTRLWLMSLQACALIIVVLLARILLKKYPKVLSYSLWALVGVRLLCPVFVESSFSLQPDFTQVAELAQEQENAAWNREQDNRLTDGTVVENSVQDKEALVSVSVNVTGRVLSENHRIASVTEEVVPEIPVSVSEPEKSDPLNVQEVLVFVYLTGITLMAGSYLVRYIVVWKKLRTAVKKEEEIWLCDRVQSPFVIGMFRPRIILPYGLGEREEQHIVLHERAHIRHCDSLIRGIGILCLCLHWWNPLVWLAVHCMNKDMEMFCDETALMESDAAGRKEYAATLLRFAMRQSGFSVGLAFGESNTEQRIKNIVKNKKRSRIILGVVVAIALLCCVAFLTIPKQETGGELTATPIVTPTATAASPEATPIAEVSPTSTPAIEKKQAHIFSRYDVLTEYEVPQYSIERLLEVGTVRTMKGDAPGTGECVWYFIEHQGVMYYLCRLADEPETELQLCSYAYVEKKYALVNHLQVGLTKEQVLQRYPDMAIVPIKGEAYEENPGWNLGFNSGAYPSSIAGQDENFNYGDRKIWFWQEQFDYCMLAEIEGETKLGRTMALALMMKDDKVAAITFYCPNDGFITPSEWNLEIFAVGDFEWPDETFFKVNSKILDENLVEGSAEEEMLKAYQNILFDLLYECKLPDSSDSDVIYAITFDRFTICDVDFDGRDELMILHSATYGAQTRTYILEYQPETDTLYEEAVIYPGFRVFENGMLSAISSHNHSYAVREGRELWPYSLYQYDAENDTYEFLFEVSAWDRYCHPGSFPKEVDEDGDGMVYCFTADGTWQDGAAYEAWFAETFGNLAEGDLSWKNLTEEEISALMRN